MRRRPALLAALWLIVAVAAPAGERADSGAAPALPWWISALQADVRVTVGAISWRGIELSALELPLRLRDGRLEVRGARASVAGGIVSLELLHDPEGETRLALQGSGVSLGALPGLDRYLEGVPVALEVELRGAGASALALKQSLSGHARAWNTGSGLLHAPAQDASGGALRRWLSSLNPFPQGARSFPVDCVVMDWTFRGGRAHDALAVELSTPRIRVSGGGDIDLVAGTIELALRPRARADIDPANLAVAESLWIEGPLLAPRLRVERGGVLGRAAAYGGDAVATLSGARMLLDILDGEPAAPSPCERTRGPDGTAGERP